MSSFYDEAKKEYGPYTAGISVANNKRYSSLPADPKVLLELSDWLKIVEDRHLGLGLVFDASAEVEDPVHGSGHVPHLLIRVPCVFLRKDVESLCSEDPGLNPVSEGLLREAGNDHLYRG
jgi:hypothetical protein